MNCANHPANPAVAYCRTCGKPLCSTCTRDVKGVIYCENCLAERLAGVQPATPPPPAAGLVGPGQPVAVQSSGPNPAVAGILAGFFPFGVGAVYCGQYAKGLAHLLIFVGLIVGMDQGSPLDTICAFAFAFFYVWQIIDAVRTAKALQLGQPAPDPLGLGQAFGAGERIDTSRVPTAAIVLIGLGVLFLLRTIGVFEFSVESFWPVLLILLGLWMFAKRWGWIPSTRVYSHAERMRGLVGPVVLVTVGLLSLIEHMGGPAWHRTWPVLLLAIGITKLLESKTPPTLPPPTTPMIGGPTAGTGETQAPVTEVRNG
ncbi:MAG TPA: B-box zinc finger protein [Terriglobales bacterium]|nr:B-box zinc finger protein [Terriglobales bacterium]